MDPLHVERIGPSEQPVRCDEEGLDMSSYANYCHDQAADCARRARSASSPEIIAYCHTLELRWLKLARWAQKADSALGYEHDPAATLLPLRDKPAATYPMEYGKRAGELIARGARSLYRT
jgi:hypothetical protein